MEYTLIIVFSSIVTYRLVGIVMLSNNTMCVKIQKTFKNRVGDKLLILNIKSLSPTLFGLKIHIVPYNTTRILYCRRL
jgi:hypothetical protein